MQGCLMARLWIRFETLPSGRVIVRAEDGRILGNPKGYAAASYAFQGAEKAVKAQYGRVSGDNCGAAKVGFDFGFYLPTA